MKQPLDSNESLAMMVDHSNQIGPEKVMLALGVNAAAMPEPGKALTRGHVRVLEVKPGDSWKTADMEKDRIRRCTSRSICSSTAAGP